MSRFTGSVIATVFLINATSAVGDPPQAAPPNPVLMEGLHAVGASASSQAQPNGSSQGAEHASEIAILTVCSHDNPSAQRAAICAQPNSPP